MNKGERVELIRCNDPHTNLQPSERGTVAFVDGLGTVHVRWDSGSSLGLCREDGDAWRVLEDPPELKRGWDGLPRIGDKYGPLWLRHPYFAEKEPRPGS